MSNRKDTDLLASWVDEYYKGIIKNSKIQGVNISYYKSLKGYFKHATILTDIKLQEFGLVDYRIWEKILTETKSSRNTAESGGLFFRFSKFKDVCGRRAFYSTKKKFLKLDLLIETPFKDFYLINPLYIIKLYNPQNINSEE